MFRVLCQVDTVPVLCVRYAKNEINAFSTALLPIFHRFGRVWMWTEPTAAARVTRLRKDAGSIGKGISNGRSELPQDLPQGFFEVFVDLDVLIGAKQSMRKFRKVRNVEVGIILPAGW